MHVNIRGFRALLSRDGAHGFHQARDSPGGLFCVVKQRLNLQPQGDPRVAESVLWQKFAPKEISRHVKCRSSNALDNSMKTNPIAQDSGWNFSFWFAVSSPLLGVLLALLALAIFCR